MAKKVLVAADKLVIVTDDYGGHLAGKCVACDESGWLDPRYGYPFGSKNARRGDFTHKKTCPVNRALAADGELKK